MPRSMNGFRSFFRVCVPHQDSFKNPKLDGEGTCYYYQPKKRRLHDGEPDFSSVSL